MRFLSTLFWVLLAVLVALFARGNWTDVTLNLWNDIIVVIKLPLLVLLFFLIGWLPTWLIMRARVWGLNRRVEALDRQRVTGVAAEPVAADEGAPVK
jgi:uncharacterized integral membrane protein